MLHFRDCAGNALPAHFLALQVTSRHAQNKTRMVLTALGAAPDGTVVGLAVTTVTGAGGDGGGGDSATGLGGGTAGGGLGLRGGGERARGAGLEGIAGTGTT